jgi:hypothetical protein
MATLSYPTSLSVPGPWLLAHENLASLDRIIDSCVPGMQERRNEVIESSTRKHLERYEQKDVSEEVLQKRAVELRKLYSDDMPAKPRRRVVVYMSGGRSAEGETFEELSNLPHMNKEVPRGFSLSARCADIEISVRQSYSSYNRDLEASVSCDDSEIALELFGKLDNWVSDLQPRKWIQIWLKAEPVAFMLTAVAFALFIVFLIATLKPQEGPSLVRQQATELAREGVSPSNEVKAIQLLLDLELGYEPVAAPRVRRFPGPQLWAYYLVMFSFIVTLKLPPKGALGIWGGRRSLERQRAWIRIVSITVPSLFLSSLFVPWLLHLLGLPG